MSYPYRIATLIYAFNEADAPLLLCRKHSPNQGLWSPCGGKLKVDQGESPHACAARETREELSLAVVPSDFHLTGIISEHGYQGEAHWLMFLFELLPKLSQLPPPCPEGEFRFVARESIPELPIPETDREQIWPLFWRFRRQFFVAHCHCGADGNEWTLEQPSPTQTH